MSSNPWGATVPTQREQFEIKRQAILCTAARMIRLRGYEQTLLGDVADELKISKPTVYYYFRNKGEIVRELLETGVNAFLDPNDHPEDFPEVGGLTGADRLERFLRRSVRGLCVETGSCLMTTPREILDAETRQLFHVKQRPVDNMGCDILRSGIADGSIADCDVPSIYLMIIGAMRHIPFMHFERGVPVKFLADTLVQMVMSGLRR